MSRSERIDIRGMDYAPENEQGVVYLFALLAPRLGFKGLERIRQGFPDAVARRRVSRGEERINIEFEYRSSSYRAHKHSSRVRLTIVCWIHDWAKAPANIQIIELRREIGLGFDVWIQAVWGQYWHKLDAHRKVGWSVPSLSKPGDLLVFYRVRPLMHIQEIYCQMSRTRPDQKWKYWADLKPICHLPTPVTLERIKQERGLERASFIRGNLQGRRNITADWPSLYNLIVRLNRSAAKPLQRFSPEWL